MMMRKLYKKLSATAVMLLMLASVVLAQDRTVSGTVSDGSGSAMPGVNVVIKGTSNGTTTDASGKYSITAGNDAVLVFSFIGYASQQVTVGNRTSVDVTMAEDAQQLSEVVVTALGIQRDKKALQYSVTSVGGENFTQARENNLGNSLAGRVAGVNVTKVSSGPAGSSRVVIRGAKSLGGNNQPLYVIDGIPMDNSNFGQAGVWGGSDEGDGLSSINPDDIESITVLKGGNAAALYGSRAANGVINVVTKKGSASKGLGIEFNSNYVLETVNDLRDIQTSYGGGAMVGATLDTRVATKANSISQLGDAFNGGWYSQGWGPKYDGSDVVHFDGVTRKYNYAGNNWDRFYNTGKSFTNSIAFTGGSETQNFRVGISNLNSTGIVPNTGYDRLNLSLAANSKFGKKITLGAKMLYTHEDVKNRPNVSDSPGSAVQAMWRMAGDLNVEDQIGDPNKPGAVPSLADQAAGGITIYDGKKPGEEMQISNNLWGQNPYWAAHQFINSDKRDRLITSGQLRYDITDFLYIQGRGGLDSYTRRGTGLTPQGTGYNRGGGMSEDENRTMEYNLEYIVGFNKAFGDFNVNAFFGGNKMYRKNEYLAANGNGFNVEFFPAINNSRDRNFGYGFSEQGINSVFGSAEVSYKNYLFLTGTVRNDWFSVLNPEVNSIMYPSVGASFVFSDAFELPSVISFGKIRASFAEVGSATIGPYSTLNTYSLINPHLGRPMAAFSSAGGFSGNLPNPALQPAVMSEIEVGFDLRLFQNRLGIDFTYYNQTTTDDILNANISRASGFGSTSVNLGEMTNKGVEILLSGTPIKKGDFSWDVSLNFAKNNNEVVSLIEGNNELNVEEPRTRTVYIKHIVGQPFGAITGLKQLTSPDGQLVYNATTGQPIQTPSYLLLGNGVPDFTGGLNNNFTYKGINLSFLIDFKAGGDIYSGTNVRLTGSGFHKQTLEGRAGEAPMVRTGVSDANGDGVYEPFTKTYSPGAAASYWGALSDRAQENFIYDASFAKLRQLTLGYSLPKSLLAKTAIKNATISFVGRNLAILFKNTDNIDPESSYSSSNGQGLDYFGVPSTRSYGFNLKLVF